MPGGVPVASMAIGKAGAKNAALFSVQILATADPKLRTKLANYKKQMAKEVERKDKRVKNR
jgi:5-(carboxyamino)imidazole ribonucleotide mutase